MDKDLSYQQARRIRKTGFSGILSDQLLYEPTVMGALKRTVSLKLQSKLKGIQEQMDPLAIAKRLTFGSRIGPALLGKLTGRSRKDIEYFTGRLKPIAVRTGSKKITPLPKEGEQLVEGQNVSIGGINKELLRIYKFLKVSQTADKKRKELTQNFAEEKQMEAERRHQELLKALAELTGKKTKTKTKAKAIEVELPEEQNSFDPFWEKLLKMVPLLGWLAAYVTVPALAGALFNEYWQNRKKEKERENIQDAEKKGGPVAADAAAQLEAMQREGTIDLPENEEKVKLLVQQRDDAIKRRDVYREEFYRANGFRKKGDKFVDGKGNTPTPELVKASEDYVADRIDAMNRGEIRDPVGKIDQNMAKKFYESKTQKETPKTEPPKTETKPTTPAPVPSGGNEAKLNSVISENVDAKLPKAKAEVNVTTNNIVKNSKKDNSNLDKLSEIGVRNDEPTLLRMIMNSTRVV